MQQQVNTAIFDMDGLLIDSEPLWDEAATTVFERYGFKLSAEQYATTTGLRTREFVSWWLQAYHIPATEIPVAEQAIINVVTEKVQNKAMAMPGVGAILNFFVERNFKIGIASSSPQSLIDVVVAKLGIGAAIQATASAESLPYGKPHPDVYLQCAAQLGVTPTQCIAFEDSFNGMIAAKAARMKCVVVPAAHQRQEKRWAAADLQLTSLGNFGALHLHSLTT
ncbi:MAG TPA: hexitol phosphatase HxpB [Chitinophagaceae bacterium]|nr:hexitol phosphatase HxpB [Chitinophagaceae bacterium]HAN39605.1 hexitol phosphatase HxpB [Chitinophagaceae bacterium]